MLKVWLKQLTDVADLRPPATSLPLRTRWTKTCWRTRTTSRSQREASSSTATWWTPTPKNILSFILSQLPNCERLQFLFRCSGLKNDRVLFDGLHGEASYFAFWWASCVMSVDLKQHTVVLQKFGYHFIYTLYIHAFQHS